MVNIDKIAYQMANIRYLEGCDQQKLYIVTRKSGKVVSFPRKRALEKFSHIRQEVKRRIAELKALRFNVQQCSDGYYAVVIPWIDSIVSSSDKSDILAAVDEEAQKCEQWLCLCNKIVKLCMYFEKPKRLVRIN